MKIPLSALRQWVDVAWDARELGDRLSMAGFELESLAPAAEPFAGVVIAQILEATPHPQADKLRVCRVDDGSGSPLQIVCGAANARAGLKTALARVGASLPGGLNIKAAKLRGVESAGMLCSAKELSLAELSDGILELPEDAPVGTDFRQYFDLDDVVLELAITPNRGDAMSVRGIAREVAALTLHRAVDPQIEPVSAGHAETFPVRVLDEAACPRIHARVVSGIDNSQPSPWWLRERLRRAGVRSISPVVDITNYLVLEWGQPMHAYDLDTLQGELQVRPAAAAERCELLDGRTVTLETDVLVIADSAGPVALAGVMGGLRTAVTPATRRVLFEVAWFAPSAIAGRGRRYGLTTDASQRFERGVDPEIGLATIERATSLLLEMCGGSAGPVETRESAAHLPARPLVRLRRDQVSRLLGISLTDERILEVLRALGMTCNAREQAIEVEPPSYRFDIRIERDLIEELARSFGYDAIPLDTARVAQAIRPLDAARIPEQRLLDLLAARGFHEGVHFAFGDPLVQRQLFPEVAAYTLSNPIVSDLAVMRVSLWPGLLRAAQENQRRQQARVRLFECAVVFPVGQAEVEQIAGLTLGARHPEQWGEADVAADFHDLRADVEALFSLAGVADLSFEPQPLSCLHPGRSARIVRDGQPVGWIGELHPRHVRDLGFSQAPLVFEIEAAALHVHASRYTEVSKFPQVRRDLSLVVDDAVSYAAVRTAVQAAGGPLLRDCILFDVYRGPGIESGRKSIALGLIFQDNSRTLTDDDTEALLAAVRARLSTDVGAYFRE